MTEKTWSEYQQAIFEFTRSGEGNAMVLAAAGAGKSTTIIEAINYTVGTSLFLAFNKSIADELKDKGVNARTFHSICYSPVLRHFKLDKVEGNKTRLILRNEYPEEPEESIRAITPFVERMVSLAKNYALGLPDSDIEDTFDNWNDIRQKHSVELGGEWKIEDAIRFAREVFYLTLGIDQRKQPVQPFPVTHVDFDDLLYMTCLYNLNLRSFDFVFCDEVQDTNNIQRGVLRRMLGADSRLIAVGDNAQAIYGFRGSDTEAIGRFIEEFQCKIFRLPISYRCAESIVRYAQEYDTNILPRPGAPEGEVEHFEKWNISMLNPGDLVVCRNTAPLMSLAFHMLRMRKPVSMAGRDIQSSLHRIISAVCKRLRDDSPTVSDFRAMLINWQYSETQKYIKSDENKKAESVADRCGALLALCDSVSPDDTVHSLVDILDEVFRDKNDSVKLSSIHRAKGLEADTVWWLDSWLCPSMWAEKDWEIEQERNLCYVAITRAKNRLYKIDTQKPKSIEEQRKAFTRQ